MVFVIRLFVAIELPGDLRARLVGLGGGVPGARWLTVEQMHLTLRFIGEVDGALARDVEAALLGVRAQPFEVSLAGVTVFGHPKAPRTLVVEVARCPELARLHDAVERAMVEAGLEPERRKFRPHVTLARLRNPARYRLDAFLASRADFLSPAFTAGRFALISSHLSSSGASYQVEQDYPLE